MLRLCLYTLRLELACHIPLVSTGADKTLLFRRPLNECREGKRKCEWFQVQRSELPMVNILHVHAIEVYLDIFQMQSA